jgi:hypothetical protein
MSRSPEADRPPDLRVGPFVLWVHGYERADSDEYYDANWHRVTAHCGAAGESVDVSGSILMTADLEGLRSGLERMHTTMSGSASLEPLEPNLTLQLVAGTHGHVEGVVTITPDHFTQSHEFRFDLDQSFLPGVIAQIRTVLETWPVRLRP